MGIIYSYTNLINGKKYIGQTINPQQRYNAHKSASLNENDQEYNSAFHRAIRKYGWENFRYEILNETDNIELLNELEIFYIDFYQTKVPNGYNVLDGGKNCKHPMSETTKDKLRWSHGKLTKDEVIILRLAYANNESPKAIYEEYFKDKLAYSSFLNIWSGNRYKTVMPELIQKGRKTKLTQEQVKEIKILLKNNGGTKFRQIAEQYGVTKGAIEAIDQNKTWKDVQI